MTISTASFSALAYACSSSDESTHGFVVDSGSGNPGQGNGSGDAGGDNGDDSSVGMPVPLDSGDTSPDSGDDSTPDSGNGDDTNDGGSTPPGSDSGSGTSDGGGGDGAAASATPVCDGVVGANEYGDPTNGQHSYLSGANTQTGQTWYMTWDDVNLYVAFVNATVSEPLVLYVGDNSKAATGYGQGFVSFDGTAPSSLAFPANFVVYAKFGYAAYRTATATGWGANPLQTPAIQVCATSATATTRELVIPWAVDNGAGRPVNMKFNGYGENGNMNSPYIYGQMPSVNPGGTSVTSPDTQYFGVINTGDGGAPPFQDPL